MRPATRPWKSPGTVYHLGLRPGDLPATVLVPGDPDRATRIAESWEGARALGEHREFRSYRGRYRGVDVAVVSSGIGGPAMAIVVEELARLGVRTILRVGSCGAVAPGLRGGDLAISSAAARFDLTSRLYAPPEYPAVADPEVVAALSAAARDLEVRHRVGVTATVGTFYLDQGRAGWGGYLPAEAAAMPGLLRRLRILNIEMEVATLLTIAGVYGLRAGAVCSVFADRRDGQPTPADVAPMIRVANEAVRRLASSTGRRGRTGTARRAVGRDVG